MKRLTLGNPNTPEAFDRLWSHEVTANRRQWGADRFRELMDGVFDGTRIVDLGCGCSGFLSFAMNHRAGLSAVGIDYSPWAIEYMRRYDPRISWFCDDARHVPYPDGFFDVVQACDVIEHVEAPEELLDEMVRLVRHGGTLRLTVTDADATDRFHVWDVSADEVVLLLERRGLRATRKLLGARGMVTATRGAA